MKIIFPAARFACDSARPGGGSCPRQIKLTLPLTAENARELRAGDSLLLSGVIYTGRDAAHKRMIEMLGRGEPLPFDVQGAVIYYTGPAPAKPGQVIGSAGPTTSYRMDPYTPALLDLGLAGMIGKGRRSAAVEESISKNGAVYFAAIGGAGALLASRIKKAEVAAFGDLGPEAVYRLKVEDFPVITATDSHGGNLYVTGPQKYLSSKN